MIRSDVVYRLGSLSQGITEADVKARIGKARAAFLQLKNIWKSNVLSLKNKIRIFNTNVKAVLPHGAETWRTTVITIKRIQTFVNSCLRRILGVLWPEIISNERLWQCTCQMLVEQKIRQRRWRWIDWSYSLQTSRKHCTTSINLESRGVKEKRMT